MYISKHDKKLNCVYSTYNYIYLYSTHHSKTQYGQSMKQREQLISYRSECARSQKSNNLHAMDVDGDDPMDVDVADSLNNPNNPAITSTYYSFTFSIGPLVNRFTGLFSGHGTHSTGGIRN